jgi:hypothetical protein
VETPWGSCTITHDGGSRQEIPFYIAGNSGYAPLGTDRYQQDIHVVAPIVLLGEDSIQLKERAVMMCYDLGKDSISVEKRINRIAKLGARAIMLISCQKKNPVVFLDYQNTSVTPPEVPVICINQQSVHDILLSAGKDTVGFFGRMKQGNISSEKLICKLNLKLEGDFNAIETEHFEIRFRKKVIEESRMMEIADLNEKSVDFLENLFNLEWEKSFMVYFAGYDSKQFYTLHTGRGFSTKAGNFLVHDRHVPDYRLIVHENTHTLINNHWGPSSSFLDEGIAKYAEDRVAYPGQNVKQTRKYLEEGKLLPLKELVRYRIGKDSPKTPIAYAASGCFVEFFMEKYGKEKLKALYQHEGEAISQELSPGNWESVIGKSLSEMEEEWLKWLEQDG